jgi:hypothetical protein
MKLVTASDCRTAAGFRHGGGAASDSSDGAVGMGRGKVVWTGAAARSERRGAVGTPARVPDSAFNAPAWRVAATRQWRVARQAQHRQRRLTGGTQLSVFFELKLPRTKIAQNK